MSLKVASKRDLFLFLQNEHKRTRAVCFVTLSEEKRDGRNARARVCVCVCV